MGFYDKLSLFVGTRTSSQCRSHHQKLFTKYKHLTKIRELFRNEIGVSSYKEQLARSYERMVRVEKEFEANKIILEASKIAEEEQQPASEPLIK